MFARNWAKNLTLFYLIHMATSEETTASILIRDENKKLEMLKSCTLSLSYYMGSIEIQIYD